MGQSAHAPEEPEPQGGQRVQHKRLRCGHRDTSPFETPELDRLPVRRAGRSQGYYLPEAGFCKPLVSCGSVAPPGRCARRGVRVKFLQQASVYTFPLVADGWRYLVYIMFGRAVAKEKENN